MGPPCTTGLVVPALVTLLSRFSHPSRNCPQPLRVERIAEFDHQRGGLRAMEEGGPGRLLYCLVALCLPGLSHVKPAWLPGQILSAVCSGELRGREGAWP